MYNAHNLHAVLQGCHGSADEKRLYADLLIGYNSQTRPVLKSFEPVHLKLGVSLREAIDLNEDLGQVTLIFWLKMVRSGSEVMWICWLFWLVTEKMGHNKSFSSSNNSIMDYLCFISNVKQQYVFIVDKLRSAKICVWVKRRVDTC